MKLNKYIDHTILKADANKASIEKLCLEAKEYDFASVCINSCWVKYAYELLKGTDVNVCTVVGFPLGACTTSTKAFETMQAIKDGASEIDMVINVGKLKDHDLEYVTNDIKEVVKAADGKVVKVIIEACLLTEQEKIDACNCSVNAGADFVKTSTGFSISGAKVEDVKLMKETVKGKCKVKAAGGIRTFNDAMAMIQAGADRLGCSAGIAIMSDAK